jgi:hypothetical protein
MNRPKVDDLKPSRRPDSRASVSGSVAFNQSQMLCYRMIAINPDLPNEAKTRSASLPN